MLQQGRDFNSIFYSATHVAEYVVAILSVRLSHSGNRNLYENVITRPVKIISTVCGRFATWTFRTQDVSPLGRFTTRTFRPLDVSPLGRFALWTFRPLIGRFAPVSGLFAPACKLQLSQCITPLVDSHMYDINTGWLIQYFSVTS